MSITSMVREQVRAAEQEEAVRAASAAPGDESALPLQTGDNGDQQISNALDALSKYIPSESIALYLAAASAMSALEEVSNNGITPERTYWFFVILTPVLFLLIFLGEMRRVSNWKTLFSKEPIKGSSWWKLLASTWWKIVASTLAFGFWALAVPTAPYLTSDEGRVVAALMAVFASTMISIIGTIVDPPKPKS